MQYIAGIALIAMLVLGTWFYLYGYVPPNCFDNSKNGIERGIDCGGTCLRICSFDVIRPTLLWSRAFKIQEGQYNALAYIENPNVREGTPSLKYALKLYDENGLITEREGTTVLTPRTVVPIFEGRVMTGVRIPTRTEVELFPDDAIWQVPEDEHELFTVMSRQFKDADSVPKLTAQIRNQSLMVARDVDIVATVFDSAGKPLTTSSTFVDYFPGRTTQDVVFTWPQPIATTIKSCEIPTDVLVAIDLSGSMNDDGGTPPEPISSVLVAAEAFVDRLKRFDQVGLITYATNAILVEPLTVDKVHVSEAVRALTIDPKEESGSTNTGSAFRRALEEFESERHNSDARKALVLLSDGLANAPENNPEAYALAEAEALKRANVNVYTIGLGEKVNDSFLRSVASANEQYLKAVTSDRLDSVYRAVTSALCEEGAAVVEIVPKYRGVFAPLR
jgi:Mg-chelatase subunit ChlD